MTARVETLAGAALQAALPALADLRIAVFRDWPYLYDGTLGYERTYLDKFAATAGSLIVAAFDGARIVGAATASPLLGHADDFAVPFKAAGHDPARIYYFGESVLLPAYRGQGLGHAFFDHREAAARAADGFTHTAFCAVIRPVSHALKPPGYRPLDAFWSRRGYHKADGLLASFAWKDRGQPHATAHPMQFWLRGLA